MKKYLIFAAAALTLAACSNDENLNDGPVELRLSSGIEVQTRATHNLDTQLKDGEQVHVWVDDATTGTALYNNNLYNNNLLSKGNGGALSGGTPMYFPPSGSVDIYALHGNMTVDNAYPMSALTHTVAEDQRSAIATAGEGYQGSDLVYAKLENVQRTPPTTTATLNFHHLLSKVEVVLIQGAGDGSFLQNITSLQVLNTQPTASFTLDKATAADAITVTASGTAFPISLDTDLSASSAETDQVLNEAIIVPQTINSGTEFIRVQTAESTFTYDLANTTAFESGKKYKYIVTVRETGLEVNSQISDWTDGVGDDNGYAQEEVN